jgi:hypothetical protein
VRAQRKEIMMRFVIAALTAAALAITAPSAGAERGETFVQIGLQGSVSTDGFAPTATLLVEQPVSGTLGWTAFGLVSPSWAEGYVGFTVSPRDWLTFSLSAGLEVAELPLRVAASMLLTPGRFFLLGIAEYGGSGRWHHVRMGGRLGDHVMLGAMSQRFEGEGPFICVGGEHLGVLAAFLFDTERFVADAEGDHLGDFFTALVVLQLRP